MKDKSRGRKFDLKDSSRKILDKVLESSNGNFSYSLVFTKWKPFVFNGNYPPYKDKKGDFLKDLRKNYVKFKESPFVREKLKSLLRIYKESGFKCLRARLLGKAIIGAGDGNVLENSIRLHHLYGFPYIPSSSIKGVLRYVAIAEKFGYDDWKKLKEKDDKISGGENLSPECRSIAEVFGSRKFRGGLMIADAVPDPKEVPEVSYDVLTPHYMKYYENLYSSDHVEWGEEYEMDNPVPVYYPVVKGGVMIFCYRITKDTISPDYVESLFAKAFEMGFGSKIRYGYGTFKHLV